MSNQEGGCFSVFVIVLLCFILMTLDGLSKTLRERDTVKSEEIYSFGYDFGYTAGYYDALAEMGNGTE